MDATGDKPPTACPVSEPTNHAPIAARGTRITLWTLKRLAPPRPVTIINVAMAGVVESRFNSCHSVSVGEFGQSPPPDAPAGSDLADQQAYELVQQVPSRRP
jgi:hypothetical protein